LPGQGQKAHTRLFTLEGRRTLKQVVEQGFAEILQSYLGQLKQAAEGVLLVAVGVRGKGAFEVLDWLAAPNWAASCCCRWRF
jgi:hypothetical protein